MDISCQCPIYMVYKSASWNSLLLTVMESVNCKTRQLNICISELWDLGIQICISEMGHQVITLINAILL